MKQIRNIINKILFGVIIIILVTSNAIILNLYLKSVIPNEEKVIDSTGDELSRVKYFIKDWFDEIYMDYSSSLDIYYNELRFNQGNYTLTCAADRIRAVYPRGVRYFQLQYVTYIEFIRLEGYLQCRLYFNETGEYLFKLKKI